MEEPDNVAHGTGPDSDATKAMLKKVDADFKFFQRKMDKAGLLDKVMYTLVNLHQVYIFFAFAFAFAPGIDVGSLYHITLCF